MSDLRNVLVHGGRTIHTADPPSRGAMDRDGHWRAQITCKPFGYVRHLREATVADLDIRPRCRTCFPNGGAP